MGHASAACGAALLAALAAAPPPPPVVVPDAAVVLDGSAAAFADRPADLELRPLEPGGRTGRVWLAATETALVVTGEVDGPAPRLAATEPELLASDHVEVWLAGPRDPVLPPLGWANQFGEETLPQGEASCAAWAASDRGDHAGEARCRAWVKAQAPHRVQLRRLFARQWLLGDGVAAEAFATPALAEVVRRAGPLDADVAPRGGARMLARTDPARPGYTFQVELPFASFPPLDDLELRELRLRVDVSSAAPPGRRQGPLSSTSRGRRGSPATFTTARLARPRRYQVTPCELPLEGEDAFDERRPAWFVPPRHGLEVDAPFVIVNPPRPYQYSPRLPSPALRRAPRFARPLEPDGWLCGPTLAIRRDGAVRRTALRVAEEGLEARPLPDGTLLVKSGPRTFPLELPAGQCGGCPRWEVRIIAVAPDGTAAEALALHGVTEPEAQETDVVVAPDWTTVTVFERRSDDGGSWEPWKAARHCLRGHGYVPCAPPPDARPPDPPALPLRSPR